MIALHALTQTHRHGGLRDLSRNQMYCGSQHGCRAKHTAHSARSALSRAGTHILCSLSRSSKSKDNLILPSVDIVCFRVCCNVCCIYKHFEKSTGKAHCNTLKHIATRSYHLSTFREEHGQRIEMTRHVNIEMTRHHRHHTDMSTSSTSHRHDENPRKRATSKLHYHRTHTHTRSTHHVIM